MRAHMPKSSHDHVGGHARGLWYMCDMHLAGQLAEGVLDGRPISHSGRCTLASCHNSIGAAGTQGWNRGCAGSGACTEHSAGEEEHTAACAHAGARLPGRVHPRFHEGWHHDVGTVLLAGEIQSVHRFFSFAHDATADREPQWGIHRQRRECAPLSERSIHSMPFLWGMWGRLAPLAVLGQRKVGDYIRGVVVQHHLLDECKHDATQSVAVAL